MKAALLGGLRILLWIPAGRLRLFRIIVALLRRVALMRPEARIFLFGPHRYAPRPRLPGPRYGPTELLQQQNLLHAP